MRNNVAIAECVKSLRRDIREQVVHVIGHLVTEISNARINEPQPLLWNSQET